MTDITYTAAVYSRDINYTNLNGEEKTATLRFALDPLKLMRMMSTFTPKKSKSRNPAVRNQPAEISDDAQLKFIGDLAAASAGFPSVDGETWYPFEDFENTILGKAFITKLASSDDMRKEFAEKVVLDPFRAFVNYAINDEGNNKAEVAQFQQVLTQMEGIFTGTNAAETLEERRERLKAEMAALDNE